MSTKSLVTSLIVLLLAGIGAIIYLITSNPVKGYSLVYDRNNYKLYVKDSTIKNAQSLSFTEGGRRVSHKDGIEMIKKYRSEIKTHEDSLKMTRYVDFNFDNVFGYLAYVLSIQGEVVSPKDTLGFRVYIGTNVRATQIGTESVFSHTTLFAPIKGHNLYKFVFGGNFDFFDQGSICPTNCPTDDEGKLLPE